MVCCRICGALLEVLLLLLLGDHRCCDVVDCFLGKESILCPRTVQRQREHHTTLSRMLHMLDFVVGLYLQFETLYSDHMVLQG